MSEAMPGWSEFQAALSQLQSVTGGGGGVGAAGGGGGGGSAGGGGGGSNLSQPNFGLSPGQIPDAGGYPVAIDVGNLSKAQTAPLFDAGFKGVAGDNAERVYGTTGSLGQLSDSARLAIPTQDIHLDPRATQAGYILAEDRTVVKPGYYG
jgi:hypothetical protein